MKIICAWCGRLIRQGPLPASHAMCQECFDVQIAELDAYHAELDKTVTDCADTDHEIVKRIL